MLPPSHIKQVGFPSRSPPRSSSPPAPPQPPQLNSLRQRAATPSTMVSSSPLLSSPPRWLRLACGGCAVAVRLTPLLFGLWCCCTLAAEADPRDQGLPPDGEEEGREVGADQEDQGRRQVQGALLQVPLHPLRLRRRQGQQAQAVAPPRSVPTFHLPFSLFTLFLSSTDASGGGTT